MVFCKNYWEGVGIFESCLQFLFLTKGVATAGFHFSPDGETKIKTASNIRIGKMAELRLSWRLRLRMPPMLFALAFFCNLAIDKKSIGYVPSKSKLSSSIFRHFANARDVPCNGIKYDAQIYVSVFFEIFVCITALKPFFPTFTKPRQATRYFC